MLFKKLLFISITAGLILSKAGAMDVHHESAASTNHQGLALSPALTQLLVEEMRLIEQGMMSLVPAIASGRWDEVSEIGSRIQHSYILKQKLSPSQLEELHHALPPAFQELDQGFHRAAGMLAHAAKMKNTEVVNFYFYKLNEGCVACHSKFAAHRFPGLAGGGGGDDHRH